MTAPDRSTVAVLVFDGAPLFETSVPLSVFGVDRTDSGGPSFEVLAVAADGHRGRSTAGLEVQAPYTLDDLSRAGLVIVPSWRSPDETPPPAVVESLLQAHRRGSIVMSLCLGAFVLGATGLLDGRRAATHWFHAPALQRRYPAIEVDPTDLFVDHGDVVTSAGTAAGLDACLHMVRRLRGADAAAAIARRMVTPPVRIGNQAQFIERPLPAVQGDAPIETAVRTALGGIGQPISADSLAASVHLSRRTFDRRFRASTGVSFQHWMLHQRVARAQRLLETTDLPVDAVARAVGLSTAVTLRPHFRAQVGVSPQQYRRQFRARSDVT